LLKNLKLSIETFYSGRIEMNFKKTMFALAIGSVGIVGAMSAHAVAVNNGDLLSIQTPTSDSSGYVVTGSGSFFAMDINGDGLFQNSERIALRQGTTGLVIGTATTAGPSHWGNPVGAEAGSIDAAWVFLGSTGSDYTTVGVTGDTVTGLNFSGWRLTWNGIPSIYMGGGMQNCGTASDGICLIPGYPSAVDVAGTLNNGSGIAAFAWDGVYGHTYTVDYLATVPLADPSGFGGVHYQLHLQGTVTAAVPEASTYGMMLAGLGLVGFMARRRV
jgi:hypothetical protein